jgi:TRAP transporter 4TM/12TM fusion protein
VTKHGQQEHESSIQRRILQGHWRTALKILSALFSAFFIYTTFFIVPFHFTLAIYIAGTLVFIFSVYPLGRKSPMNRLSVFDCGWIIISLIPNIYFIIYYEELLLQVGGIRTYDIICALMLAIACLEACRRVLGWSLPVIAALFFIYDLLGPCFPDLVAHKGFSIGRIASTIFSQEGIYGIVARTYAVYVVIFIIFGAFLWKSGTGEAFTNLALALFGRRKGGAAKAAVFASGLAGSILGSGAANITVTGTFTIPLMKRTGFPAPVAAAIETVASVGGHLLPPVMGAAAFLMAAFTGYSYTYIIAIALFPAILLYLFLFFSVHFYSQKNPNVVGLDKNKIPPFKETLKRDGILLIPILVLIAALIYGYTPFRAAVLGIIATVGAALFSKRSRISPRKIFECLSEGAINSLVVGATAGVMGVLLATLLLPGVPLLFSSWVVAFSGGNLVIAIILVIVASYILGMGMTVTAAYILISIVAVPPLSELGVPLLAAHLMIIWYSQDSAFTPPFCLAAYVAAGIGNADPIKTGWKSVLLGKPIYIVPFLMVFTPILGLDGINATTILTWISCAIGMVVSAALFERYWYRSLLWWEMVVLSAAAILLFMPFYATWIIGLVLVLGVLIPQYRQVAPRGLAIGRN